jgi:hypothetical protein
VHAEVGYNYRMSNVLAGIGRGQLRVLDDRVAARRRVAARYAEALAGLPGVELQPEAPWGRHSRWLSVAFLDPAEQPVQPPDIIRHLEAHNIESRPIWRPMHTQPLFAGAERVGGAIAERLYQTGLCLPSSSSLSESDQDRVIEQVRALLPAQDMQANQNVGELVDEIVERTGLLKVPFKTAVLRGRGLPRSAWGATLAHLGLGITLLGIIGETQWGVERIAELKPGQTISIRRYDLHFDGTTMRNGPNYRELAARFTVRRHGEVKPIGVMEPSKRSFPSRGTATTESALMTRGFAQLYLSLGEPNPDGSLAVRLYYKPLVLLIWLGAVVMVIGGALSLSDRRLRVGAPQPARAKVALQPAE